MARWMALPAVFMAVLSSCSAAGTAREEGKLSPQEETQLRQELQYLEGQKVTRELKLTDAGEKVEELRRELETLRREHTDLAGEIEAKLEATRKLMAEAQEMARRIGPPSAQDEAAAEKLLLEAGFFQRDNPTEAGPVVASKYRLVFERYPNTKAAERARKIYEELAR